MENYTTQDYFIKDFNFVVFNRTKLVLRSTNIKNKNK